MPRGKAKMPMRLRHPPTQNYHRDEPAPPTHRPPPSAGAEGKSTGLHSVQYDFDIRVSELVRFNERLERLRNELLGVADMSGEGQEQKPEPMGILPRSQASCAAIGGQIVHANDVLDDIMTACGVVENY